MANFSAADYAEIIKGAGEGVRSGFNTSALAAQSDMESHEVKRQTFADVLNRALRRQKMQKSSRKKYQDETEDYRSQAIQGIAQGFVDAMKGSTMGRR